MSSLDALVELSTLAGSALPPEEAVRRSLVLLRSGLAASDVHLVYGDANFHAFSTSPQGQLSDVALWLVSRDLTSRREPNAFDSEGEHVVRFREAKARGASDYVSAMIPMPGRTAEMIVARGPWARGLGVNRLAFLQAALPTLALLLERRLDANRAERQRSQLNAMANITRVMAESEEPEDVLTSIAGTIAGVSGIDYISVDIVDERGHVQLRCINVERPGTEELRYRWKRGAERADPVRTLVLRTGRPALFPDAQNDERIPEAGRSFFVRTLIRSAAVFPLVTKDEVLGVLSAASHHPHTFDGAEVELLEVLAAQVATAVKGIQLYRQLAQSRAQLSEVNEQLLESMGVEHHLARTDELTGIPNRRFIDETVDAECARSSRYGQPLSVVLADLDHLKEINDSFGHAVGDAMLRHVARLARETCRNVDVVGRYGGDEFVFVLPNTGLEEAAGLAERFRQRLEESRLRDRNGGLVLSTASLGVAEWRPSEIDAPPSLLPKADRAMYAAKASGRNCTMLSEGDSARAA